MSLNDRPLISVDARSSSWEEPPWPSAFELARLLPQGSWTLVGGLMVKLHAELAGLPAPRTTVDVDSALHLETQAISFAQAAARLQGAGYILDRSTTHAYRFDRGKERVDLMCSDRLYIWRRPRYDGRPLFGIPGGARPKAAVLDNNGRQLIAKFPHHEDDWDVSAWEATALDLASAAGVLVPPRRLVRVDGRHVLLLNRFDRAENGGRIGYTSMMTMLERRDGDHADYVDIVDILAEASAQAKQDARQLFRRVAVSVGLNNTDDHLRNHGFLRVRGGWTLSPAFDVNPNPDPEPRQTTIAGADSPADEAEGLMEIARSCRLSAVEARAVLAGVADEISRWREVAVGNGVPQSQLARFEESFAAGLSTLRAA